MAQNRKCISCNNLLGRNVKSGLCKQCRIHTAEGVDKGVRELRGAAAAAAIGGTRPRPRDKVSNDCNTSGLRPDTSYTCELCNVMVDDGDRAMSCEACHKWFHTRCIDMDARLYDLLTSSNVNMRWFCNDCDPKVDDAISKISELDTKMKAIEARLEAIEQNFDVKTDYIIQKKFDEYVYEQAELEKRKTNVILHKVKEPDASLTIEQKKQEDTRAVMKIGREIGINLKEDDIRSVYRIGRKPETNQPARNRIMCVVFKDGNTKAEMLRNARNLKDSSDNELKEVFVTPDMTQRQREEHKLLRDELIRRRNNGEQDLQIRRGKIVKKNF